jgi:hypothetical protein
MELGLGMDEAMILRWFVDYQASGKMRSISFEGRSWLWVSYQGVLDDLPIVGGSPKTISRRFERLEAAGVVEHHTFKEGGVFSCYRINPTAYMTLIDDVSEQFKTQASSQDSETPDLFPVDSIPEEKPIKEGWTNEEGGRTELSNGKTELSEGWTNLSEQKTLLLDSSTRNLIPPVSPVGETGTEQTNARISKTKRVRFVKPTVEEIKAYCDERNNSIDSLAFWNFYESKGWQVGRTPMKDWKAAVVTWELKNKSQATKSESKGRVNDAWSGKKSGRLSL